MSGLAKPAVALPRRPSRFFPISISNLKRFIKLPNLDSIRTPIRAIHKEVGSSRERNQAPNSCLCLQSFINDLAGQIGLSPNQINITRVAQGSILVNADFLPISGTSLDNQTVATIQSRLVGNNAQLALGNNRYGNVFVTDLISPTTGEGLLPSVSVAS